MKKNKYIQGIERVEFSITHICTGRCKHCSVGAPQSAARLDAPTAAAALEDAAAACALRSVMVFGGEPLLWPEAACGIFVCAQALGIEKRQLITNGYFTKDTERLQSVALALTQAGVSEILLSVDAFHAERIPISRPMAFARALMQAGFGGALRLQPAWVINRQARNPWNDATERCLEAFAPLGLEVARGNDIFPAGNARLYLAEYYPKTPLDMDFRCGQAMYSSPIDRPDTVSVEPDGGVVFCGIRGGSLRRERMSAILGRYDPFASPAAAALARGGIRALHSYAQERGVRAEPDDFHSPCELCAFLMRALGER